jgi:hypothetical protein
MIGEASAAFGSIKVAMDMAKGISALQSEVEINQAIIEIQRNLLDAQSAALADKETISNLRDEIAKLQITLDTKQNWEAEKARYVLVKSECGTFFYELKPEYSDDETSHRLCSNCFHNEKKSILQTTLINLDYERMSCPSCKQKIDVREKPPTIESVQPIDRFIGY